MAKPAKDRAGTSAATRLLVEPLRAGLLGCGVFLWSIGVLFGAREDRLFSSRPSEEIILLGSFFLAVAAALAFGYRAPVRSYLGLAGRFAGGMAGGLVVFFGYMLVLVKWREHTSSEERPALFAIPGLVFTLLAVAWLHGRRIADLLRGGRRAQWLLGGAAAVVAATTAWPLSARLRCAAGSGDGCVQAARRAFDDGEGARGAALAERGCSLDSAECCRLAGDGFWRGYRGMDAIAVDRSRAEPFYRTACALGNEEGCQVLHVVELHGRCEGQRASACRELSAVYRSGEGVVSDVNAAGRFLRQACLLGDAEACRGGR